MEHHPPSLTWKNMTIFVLSYLALMMVGSFGLFLAAEFFGYGGPEDDSMMTQALLLLDFLFFFLILRMYRPVADFVRPLIQGSAFKQKASWLYILLSLGWNYAVGFFMIDYLQVENGDHPAFRGHMDESILSMLLLGLVVAVLTPIKEEVMFRGFLQSFFNTKMTFVFSVLFTSLIFGLLHPYPIVGTCLGLSFGFLFHKTQSLAVTSVAHILWNIMAVIAHFA